MPFLSMKLVYPYLYPAYGLAYLANELNVRVKVQEWNQAVRAAVALTAMVEDLVSPEAVGLVPTRQTHLLALPAVPYSRRKASRARLPPPGRGSISRSLDTAMGIYTTDATENSDKYRPGHVPS